jgi:predicted DNA-binding transcriptional regulator AlpA
MLPYITLQKMAEESGYSEQALYSKIKRGEFAEGIHYIKAPDGRVHFKVEAYLEWLSKNTVTAIKSHSGGMASVTALPSR